MAYRELDIIVKQENMQTKSINLLVPAESAEEAMQIVRTAASDYADTKLCRILMKEDGRSHDQFTWQDVIAYMPSSAWSKYHIISHGDAADAIIVSFDENLKRQKGD